MLARMALVFAACLTLPEAASADRFYFGSADAEKKMVAGSADAVEGVLLQSTETDYVIRIEGGTMTVAKTSVYKIEKDGLTVAAIEKRERDTAEMLAAANQQRRDRQYAEATARRETVQAAEALTEPDQPRREIRIVVDFQGMLDDYVFSVFDPVIDRESLSGLRQAVEAYLRDVAEQSVRDRR